MTVTMTATRRTIIMLQGTTLIALTAAALLLAWPPRVVVKPVLPALPALTAQAPPAATSASALTDSVVDANVFSLTREAPAARTFVAAPTDAIIGDVVSDAYGADAGVVDTSGTASVAADRVPALYGVVSGPSGRAALLRLDAKMDGARLFRLGEGTAGYRVRSIGADRVELSGPAGPITLGLAAKGGAP